MLVDHKKFKDKKLSASHCINDVLQKLLKGLKGFDRDKEHLYVIGLTRRNMIRYIDLVSVGSISSTVAEPCEIFRMAVHKAVGGGIILAHNHPSGNIVPSDDDKRITHKVKESGFILGIPLIDHVIFSTEGYFSFFDEGLL